MDIDSAIAKHAEWKVKFRGAINAQQTLDAATIAKDNCCDLGKWLYSDGKNTLARFPAYATCVARHKVFHQEAGKVAEAINARSYKAAEQMIDAGSPFMAASKSVAVSLVNLRKESNL